MLNLQFLEFLSEYNLNLPIWGISLLFAYSLVLILSLEKATRKGVPTKDIFNLGSIVAISGMLGARMLYLATVQIDLEWGNILSWDEIFYDGKLNIIGGYLGGLVGGWFYLQGFDAIKRSGMSWLRFFDTFLPIIPIGTIFGYIGILFITINKGAISTTEYPWLLLVGDTYVHPWALYIAFLGYIILFIIMVFLYHKLYKFKRSGYITASFVLGVSLIHFITDFWQTTDPQYSILRINGLTITQLIAIFIIILTIIGLLLIRYKSAHTE